MDLASIKFKVETDELKNAVTLVEKLGQATQELGKDVNQLAQADKNAAAAGLMNAKARREAAAAAAQEAKNNKSIATTADTAAKASDKLSKTTETVATKASAAEKMVEKFALRQQVLTQGTISLNGELQNLGKGFTSSQASALATLKQVGGTAEQFDRLTKSFKDYNDISGANPFDKVIGGSRKLSQEIRELQKSSELAGRGLNITKEQSQLLSRDLQGLSKTYQQMGKSQEYIDRATDVVTRRFTRQAAIVNNLNASAKENERLARQQANAAQTQAKAQGFVEQELRRAESALTAVNNQLSISTSNRLIKYEAALKVSGKTTAQQTAELQRYRKALVETDMARTRSARRVSAEQSERTTNLLARSLAPQISDILVSLQGGMNPFTVMMQQGMQVRDLIQLSGIETEKLGEAFKRAGQGMITTSVAAGKAIGSMILGVIADGGRIVAKFGTDLIGAGPALKFLNEQFMQMSKSGNGSLELIGRLGLGVGRLVPMFLGLSLALPIAALGGFAFGLRAVIKEENELTKALVLNNANLNMSKTTAIEYAKSFDSVGISTGRAIGVLTEAAKTGAFTRAELDRLVLSAVNLEMYGGVAIEETVKSFNKMKEEPVKALIELAKTTGMVAPEVVRMVVELEKEGKTAEATGIAIKALADTHETQVGRMKEELNGFSTFLVETGRGISDFFAGVFKDIWYAADPKRELEKQLNAVNAVLSKGDFAVGAIGITEGVDGRAGFEQIRNNLQEQLKLLKMSSDAESERTRGNVEAAKIQEKSHSAYEKSLSKEGKLLKEIRDVEKDITSARRIGDSEAVKNFENLRSKLEKDLAEARKPKKTAKTDSEKVENSLASKELKDIEKLRSAAIQAEVAARDYTAVQKAALDIFDDPAWVGYYDNTRKMWVQYSDEHKKRIVEVLELSLKEEDRYKKNVEYQKQLDQARKESFDFEAKAFEDAGKMEQSQKDRMKALKEESGMLDFQATLIGKIPEERAKEIELLKIRNDLEKELAEIRANYSNQIGSSDMDAAIANAEAIASQRIANLQKKADNERTSNLADGIADAVTTGLIEGGDAGKKKLRDILVAELQKPIKVFIQAIVGNIFGTGGGGQGGSGGGWLDTISKFFGGGSSGGSSGGGWVDTIASFFGGGKGSTSGWGSWVDTAASWFGGSGSSAAGLGNAATEVGMLTGTGTTATTGAGAGGAASGGGAALGVAGWAAIIVAAVVTSMNLVKAGWNRQAVSEGEIDKHSFGQYSSTTGQSMYTESRGGRFEDRFHDDKYNILEGLGMSEKWAEILSGVSGFAAIWGRKLKGYGYQVDVRGQDVGVQGYEYHKGGAFRSDKTRNFAIDERDAANVRHQVETLRLATKGMSAAFGGSTEALDAFSGSLQINFKNATTAEEQAKRMADGFLQLQTEMFNAGTGLQYTKEQFGELLKSAMELAEASGYSASGITDTLVAGMTGRMSQEDVGAALGDMIVGSIYNAIASSFAEQITGAITGLIIQPIMTSIIAGGTITSAVSQASINAVVQQAQTAISIFNQVISDPAFQGLIGQINTMTMQIAQVSVQPAKHVRSFGSALKSAGDAAKAAREKIAQERYGLENKLLQVLGLTAKLRARELASLHKSNRELQKQIWAIEDAQQGYEDMRSAAEDALDKAKQVQDNLKQIFDFLSDNIRELRGETEDAARMQISQADAELRDLIASGDTPEYDKLQEIVETLREGVSGGTYVSRVDRDRANLRLAALLEQLNLSVGADLEEKSEEVLLLEEALERAEEQVNALLGIQENTFTTSEAIAALEGSLATYAAAIEAGLNKANKVSTKAAPSSSSGGSSSGHSSGGGGGGGSSGSPAPAPAGEWTAAGYLQKNPDIQNAVNADMANVLQWHGSVDAYALWHWNTLGKQENRQYKKGGYYPGGSAIVGEDGPEMINFSRPGRIYTAEQTSNMLTGSSDSQVEQRLANLENVMTTVAIATNGMQKILKNARGADGVSLSVTVANTPNVNVANTTPVPVDQV